MLIELPFQVLSAHVNLVIETKTDLLIIDLKVEQGVIEEASISF